MLHVWLGNLLRKLIPASHIALAIFGLLPFRQRRTCAWTPLSIRISYLPFNGPGELDQHYVLCAGETTSRLGNQELPRFHFFLLLMCLYPLYTSRTPLLLEDTLPKPPVFCPFLPLEWEYWQLYLPTLLCTSSIPRRLHLARPHPTTDMCGS